ncbi:hypothetical protein LZ30DRAFT_300875 [Colletotrichum cereale]|nr:hypothetical protein LZ30DRAFT_300875 [Colletotrichum cereale]
MRWLAMALCCQRQMQGANGECLANKSSANDKSTYEAGCGMCKEEMFIYRDKGLSFRYPTRVLPFLGRCWTGPVLGEVSSLARNLEETDRARHSHAQCLFSALFARGPLVSPTSESRVSIACAAA